MYVSEVCAEGISVTFPWWLKHVKSRSKIALFSNERHFEIWFPKKETITFFWSKLSNLHKKGPILHVTTTVSLKQGETRTNSVPIPHPFIAVIVISDLTLYQNMNQRSLTPRWPLTPSLLRSHVWHYPRIIMSKSHENTSKYVDTVTFFVQNL